MPAAVAATARQLVTAHDFSAARAHLVASVPGYHTGGRVQAEVCEGPREARAF